NPIEGYKYRVGGQTAFYKAEDVIHFKYYNPFDFFYGLSPLAAARTSADTLDAAETYNRSFFDNSATVSGILSTEQKLDDGTRTRIMKAWRDKYRGESKAHKVALLEGGLKWQSVGVNQKDMDFISGMKMNRETLLAVFRVPPALVGVFDHAPQFNTKEQQRIFWQGSIIPKLGNILESLNEFLLPDFDREGKIYFEIDTSNVSALRESHGDIANAALTYHQMGFGKDEIIDALGLPFPKEKTLKKKR
ncbi:MAG TPA: phage portal protein, partial [Elusimicrobiales bacterium]|nr:phage portal protein [Elusimicrobiales bacterium]